MADVIVYGSFMGDLIAHNIDWESDTIKVALLADTYTPDQDGHTNWNQVSAQEVGGVGYVSGGAALSSRASTYSGNSQMLSADDVSWAESTITARYGVMYAESSGRLIAYIDFGEDKSSADGTFQITWGATGIIRFNVPGPLAA